MAVISLSVVEISILGFREVSDKELRAIEDDVGPFGGFPCPKMELEELG